MCGSFRLHFLFSHFRPGTGPPHKLAFQVPLGARLPLTPGGAPPNPLQFPPEPLLLPVQTPCETRMGPSFPKTCEEPGCYRLADPMAEATKLCRSRLTRSPSAAVVLSGSSFQKVSLIPCWPACEFFPFGPSGTVVPGGPGRRKPIIFLPWPSHRVVFPLPQMIAVFPSPIRTRILNL